MMDQAQTDRWSTVILPPVSSVTTSLGPMLTGMMLEQLVLGIVCLQTCTYFCYHFSNDDLFNRSIVTSLVVLNILLGAVDLTSIYQSTVVSFGNLNKFDLQGWTTWAEPGLTALVALIAHVFYICRCWAVTRSLVLAILLGSVALTAIASGISVSIICFKLGRFSRIAGVTTPSYVWLLSTSILDVFISITLAIYFWRRDTLLRSTSAMLSRLRRTTIETGLLTAICAILNLVLFTTLAPKGYYLLVQYSMSHIYTFSVLHTLLMRQELRNILSEGSGTFVTGFSQTSSLFAGVQFNVNRTVHSTVGARIARDSPYENDCTNAIPLQYTTGGVSHAQEIGGIKTPAKAWSISSI